MIWKNTVTKIPFGISASLGSALKESQYFCEIIVFWVYELMLNISSAKYSILGPDFLYTEVNCTKGHIAWFKFMQSLLSLYYMGLITDYLVIALLYQWIIIQSIQSIMQFCLRSQSKRVIHSTYKHI